MRSLPQYRDIIINVIPRSATRSGEEIRKFWLSLLLEEGDVTSSGGDPSGLVADSGKLPSFRQGRRRG